MQPFESFDNLMWRLLRRVVEEDRFSVLDTLAPFRLAIENELGRTPEFAELDLTSAWQAGSLALADKAHQLLSVCPPLLPMLTAQVGNEQVKLLLNDADPKLQQRGLILVGDRYPKLVVAYVRKMMPCLTWQDLSEAVQAMYADVVADVRAGKFKPTGDLVPFLAAIVANKARDLRRRQIVREAVSFDEVVASLYDGSRDSTLDGPLEEREFRQLLDTAIALLPPKQRQAMESYVTHFPDSKSMNFLRQEVEKASGEDTTVEAVKRNLAVARQKVSEYLQTQGYVIGAGGEE